MNRGSRVRDEVVIAFLVLLRSERGYFLGDSQKRGIDREVYGLYI
jgi:hypothetical protein